MNEPLRWTIADCPCPECQPAALGEGVPEMARLVSVVIVTYGSEAVIDAALASVPEGVEVIVVDNASPDRSAERVAASGATLITNSRNLGFGTACNRGAALVRTPFVLFLNPDARLTPGSLERLVSELAADPDVAAVAPLLSSRGVVQLPRQNSLLDTDRPHSFAEFPESTTDVRFLSGAALLARTALFHEIGGFDERIFLYLEDDDLCFRFCASGYRLRLVADAVVAHETTARGDRAFSLRRKNRSTLLSMRYLSEKYDLRFDFGALRRKAWRRLLLATLLCDLRRINANVGRLQGLSRVLNRSVL